MYVADQSNHRIRKVTVSTGVITTYAGSGGTGSFSGDGGDATSATLYYPTGVALDASGNVYISDNINHRIRKVSASNSPSATPTSSVASTSLFIKTIAGTGTAAYTGDGSAATSAALNNPYGVTLDSAGIKPDLLI